MDSYYFYHSYSSSFKYDRVAVFTEEYQTTCVSGRIEGLFCLACCTFYNCWTFIFYDELQGKSKVKQVINQIFRRPFEGYTDEENEQRLKERFLFSQKRSMN